MTEYERFQQIMAELKNKVETPKLEEDITLKHLRKIFGI